MEREEIQLAYRLAVRMARLASVHPTSESFPRHIDPLGLLSKGNAPLLMQLGNREGKVDRRIEFDQVHSSSEVSLLSEQRPAEYEESLDEPPPEFQPRHHVHDLHRRLRSD